MQRRLGLIALALIVGGCGERREPAAPRPQVQFQRTSADLAQHGQRLAAALGCSGCHGDDLTGKDWSEHGWGRLWTANLTRAVPRYSDAELDRVIRGGARPDRELWEMPSHLFTQLTDEDMAAVIAFLRSRPPAGEVRPEPAFGELAKREIAAGKFPSSVEQVRKDGAAWPPDAGAGHALARYIVRATCAECHGLDLRGGQPNPQAKPRPDLRIAAAYDGEQFKRLMRAGIPAGQNQLTLMKQVALNRYKHLTDAEIGAVHAYLKRIAETAP